MKIKFDGATMIDVEFDDRKYTSGHYRGTLPRASPADRRHDHRRARRQHPKNDIYEMKKRPGEEEAEVAKRCSSAASAAIPQQTPKPGSGTHWSSKPLAMKCGADRRQTGGLPQVVRHQARYQVENQSEVAEAETGTSTTSRCGTPKPPSNRAGERRAVSAPLVSPFASSPTLLSFS